MMFGSRYHTDDPDEEEWTDDPFEDGEFDEEEDDDSSGFGIEEGV